MIYVGLMITEDGPKVLEFNARFGDPECQPIMMRLKSDLIPLLEATIDGKLDQIQCRMVRRPGGLRRPMRRRLSGLLRQRQRNSRAGKIEKLAQRFCFHAGTAKDNGRWLTTGGRVLGVTARGANIADAVKEVYRAVGEISWDGMHYRKDIAQRALKKSTG